MNLTKPNSPALLTVRLLGAPAFQLDHQALSHLVTGRAAALLAYLAVTGQPQPRVLVADLLWTNVAEQNARTNLRYLLSNLRKVVGDYVIGQGETVALNQQLPHWVDVTTFTTYLTPTPARDKAEREPTLLTELLKLYNGEFMAGFQLEGAPVFDRWLLTQRRHLHDLVVQGLQLRIQLHLTLGEYADGLALNHYLLTLEPWREEAHCQRMMLLAHSGQRSAALQQYTRCCQMLAKELDVPPAPETTLLYEQIKSGQWFATHAGSGHHVPGASMPLPQPPPTTPQQSVASFVVAPPESMSRFDLGTMPNAAHFYGRQAELVTLHSWVGQEHSRLVALLGLHGQGKTALAAAFVHDVIEGEQHLAHGFTQVIWRSLQDAPTCSTILHGWLQLLTPSRGEARSLAFDELISRLFAILHTRRCLLVLDGVEAILPPRAGADGVTGAADCPNWDAYATLFRLFSQRRHQSCLLLTSQIRPAALPQLDERNGTFHCLELGGLTLSEGTALLAAQRLVGDPTLYQQLHQRYAGNPQWLSNAANLIYELFGGNVAAFLQEGLSFESDIDTALGKQLAQLPSLERQVLQRLTQTEQSLTRQALWATLTPPPAKPAYFHTLQNLQRAFMIHQTDAQVRLTMPIALYLTKGRLPLQINL